MAFPGIVLNWIQIIDCMSEKFVKKIGESNKATGASFCLDYLLSADNAAPSACFVLDAPALRKNLKILDSVQEKTGAKILLALKGFAAWSLFPMLSRMKNGPLWGTCASSVDEAHLGREEFGGEVHAFAAAWSMEEMRELVQLADHITFNSIAQWRQFRPVIMDANADFRKQNPIRCGLRVNPEHSEGAVAIYNPCSPGSRLGIRLKDMPAPGSMDMKSLDGLHFHTLCEQNSDALERTLAAFEGKFKNYFDGMGWFNFGGGHHITRSDYNINLLCECISRWKPGREIYLEPGEAVALDAGWLTARVLDIVDADMPVAILDVSAACHMPDVLEMPYKPDVWRKDNNDHIEKAMAPGKAAYSVRLAGKSCLAGDVIGEYSFSSPLAPGDRLVFGDMAIYSMVKTTTFNGLRLPSIGLYDNSGAQTFSIIREFSYNDFKCRLS